MLLLIFLIVAVYPETGVSMGAGGYVCLGGAIALALPYAYVLKNCIFWEGIQPGLPLDGCYVV